MDIIKGINKDGVNVIKLEGDKVTMKSSMLTEKEQKEALKDENIKVKNTIED